MVVWNGDFLRSEQVNEKKKKKTINYMRDKTAKQEYWLSFETEVFTSKLSLYSDIIQELFS